ncbi:uncharacterized protein LOC142525795 [Primulina tabacum]|uniref:uncharacterized protein LOC142525795 n=1 Tax=Primulina tabacum TaxID=48773 RepID=UPI003F59ED57
MVDGRRVQGGGRARVGRALFDMHPDKAPSPYGLSALIYQKFWDVVGGDVTDAVVRVLNEDAPLEAWNDTLASYAALKLDMSKAYDRVEWKFLQQMIIRLGFEGLFRGVKIAPTSPSVSHMFFADDSLVFFRATMEAGARVKECLSIYEKASGQLVNYDKSTLSFSPNTHLLLMDTTKNILTIPVFQQHDLYLGLPTKSFRSKRLQFKYLTDRVIKRIQGWG